jgi:hypothetical protein
MPSDDRLRGVVTGLLRRAHEDIDAQAPRLTADIAGLLRSQRIAGRDEHVNAFTRLAAHIRQLDDANSLSGVLKVLSAGVMAEATRVALLIVEPEQLVLWGHFGFGEAPAPADMALGRDGPFDRAIESRKPVPISLAGTDSTRPAFMKFPPDHAGLVVPIVVGDNVVALLYADGLERRPEREEGPVWPEVVEILVRHAAMRLENVTTLRTVEVLTRSA